jgi:hypothetical protein
VTAGKAEPAPASFIRSSLRIFLSVDVVGSTAFKQGTAANLRKADTDDAPAEPWFPPIIEFYREIGRQFSAEWARYKTVVAAKHGWPTGEDPEFWKGLGDEVIYVKQLGDYREALGCVHCWMVAVNRYREFFRSKFPNLNLKTTAWLAGFPVYNAEVVVRSSSTVTSEYEDDDDPLFSNLALMKSIHADPTVRYLSDYIGPSIDTGFRLCALSNPRKMVVSVDLALMLVYATRGQPGDFGIPKLVFRYDGGFQLKGVFGSAPYPIFWIDMMPDDAVYRAEDKLLNLGEVDSDRVLNYCEVFIDANPGFIFRPYIVGSREPYFAKIPPHHEERLARLRDYWQEEYDKRQLETKSQLANVDELPAVDATELTQTAYLEPEDVYDVIRELLKRIKKE